MELIREQYERSSHPIKSFLSECTENVGGEVTPKGVLFEAFCEYCRKHSIPMIYTMKGNFGDRIKKQYISGQAKIAGKTVRVWQGCKLIEHVKHVPNSSSLRQPDSRSIIMHACL